MTFHIRLKKIELKIKKRNNNTIMNKEDYCRENHAEILSGGLFKCRPGHILLPYLYFMFTRFHCRLWLALHCVNVALLDF